MLDDEGKKNQYPRNDPPLEHGYVIVIGNGYAKDKNKDVRKSCHNDVDAMKIAFESAGKFAGKYIYRICIYIIIYNHFKLWEKQENRHAELLYFQEKFICIYLFIRTTICVSLYKYFF